MVCRICGGRALARRFEVREMMFGFRDRFPYFECATCGCLQIERVPDDLGRYYPSHYYALRPATPSRGLRRRLRDARNRAAITGDGLMGRLLARFFPYPPGPVREWFRHAAVTPGSRILDVGCGSGALLRDLAGVGFRHLVGIDPHLSSDLRIADQLRLEKRTIEAVDEEFDLVMFHHSLEHVPDQLGTLASAARLLRIGGHCLIRIPVVPCEAWETYGPDWVQLDAPRHVVVHSRESIRIAAELAGLTLIDSWCDSTELQFLGSELYRNDVPLVEMEFRVTSRERRRYRRRARELNAAGRGDQAVFVFARLS